MKLPATDRATPAFPLHAETMSDCEGLTKREYMATATLAGIMPWALSINLSAEGIAHHAVAVADALIAALSLAGEKP